ncbi:phosphoribosyltransferase [Chloroflexota bacterium]
MTYSDKSQPLFENRNDAGRQLAGELQRYSGQSVIVLAIPNGGVPVALEVASALKADFDIVISRKIPLSLNPEGSLGAATDDGTIILNEEAVRKIGLNRQQVEYEASRVRGEIKQRSLLYKGERPLVRLNGKTVIVIDDGLASGYTMMAAVESTRHRRPKEIIAAVPVASAMAVKHVEKVADRVVTCFTGFMPKFYVSDFYRYWFDLTDDETVEYLKQWRMHRSRSHLIPPEGSG